MGGVRRRGRNGQVTGYRIGGKTGTADKTGTKDVVVSFMCFAPADDPQYIMLLTMDTPSRTTGTAVFGGTMVAPVASQIMSEILPLLGVEPDYTAEELVGADTTVPNVVGQTREAAEDRLADLGFTFRTVGDGDTVTDQTPPAAPSCREMPPSSSTWGRRSRTPPAPCPMWWGRAPQRPTRPSPTPDLS